MLKDAGILKNKMSGGKLAEPVGALRLTLGLAELPKEQLQYIGTNMAEHLEQFATTWRRRKAWMQRWKSIKPQEALFI